MNKLFTRIVGAALGLTMAVGVGVAVGASKKDAVPVHAASSTVTKTTNTLATEHSWGVSSGSTINGLYTSWALDSNITISTSGSANCGSVWGSTTKDWRLYQNQSGDVTVTAASGYTLTSVTFTYSVSNSGTLATVTGQDVAAANQVASNSAKSVSGTSVTYYVANTGTKTNGQVRITQFSVTYESTGGATVTGVTVTGNSSKTSYTTVDSWSNAGLTANVTMSDSSQYSGSVAWSYEPHTTPAAAVIANSNEEVTGYSLTATATAGGQSGNKTTTGVSVSYATVAQGIAATPASGTLSDVIVEGIVSQVDEVSTSNGNATYYISDDGTTIDQLKIYRGKYVDNASFTNVNQIQVGDTVVVYGGLTTYSSAPQFGAGNYLLSLDRPASSDPSITITEANFTMAVGDSDVTLHATAENIPEGGSVKWVSGTPATATVGESTGTVHALAAGTTEITAKIVNSGDETVVSNSITVTVIENALSDGDTFIIKATHSSSTYYLTGVSSNLGTTSTTKSNAMIFTAVKGGTSGQFQFQNGSDFLSYSGSSNNLYTTTDGTDASTFWTAQNNGSGIVVESANVSGRKLQFNYNSGNPRFACYSSSQTAVSIELVAAPEVDEVTVMGDSIANADGALSITKEFLYEVTYVADEGTGAVTVSVLNSNSTTDGASVTTAPSGGTFSVTFTASDTYTVTVTSIEDDTKSDSTAIVVSNIYVAVLTDYDLYKGTTVSGNAVLTEGDYIIYYDGAAVNTTVDSSRLQYEEVTPSESVISTDDTSILWHIAPSGDYYTIYNATENKYLASTGAKNKAQLLADGTDNKALWSVTINDGKFEFINKQNTTNGVNAALRKNGTYGFACYDPTSTGGTLSLYKKDYDAVGYSTILLNYLGGVCDATTGNTNVTNLTNTWKILGAEYALLDSTVKSDLTPSSDSQTVKNAISAYDYVVGKYLKTQSVTAINDFMDRDPSPVGASANIMPMITGESGVTVSVIVIVSMVSLAAIGGLVVLRKKKRD